MEQPQNSTEEKSKRSENIGLGLGIASCAIGLLLLVAAILVYYGMLRLDTGLHPLNELLATSAIPVVGLALGIAGIVLTRRHPAFSIIGIVANSLGLLGCVYFLFIIVASYIYS